jgi:membrane protein insertase Oxa1/YidC/SpoIIIJ
VPGCTVIITCLGKSAKTLQVPEKLFVMLQLVALAGLVWNPPTSCAWAARVYVSNWWVAIALLTIESSMD